MSSNWKNYNLIDLCDYFNDGNWIETKDQSTNGIRLIQTGNIGNGIYLDKLNAAKYISEDTFKRLNCSEVYPNDILISRLPKPVGRACVIPDLKTKMITAVDCTIVRVNKQICDYRFLLFSLMNDTYFNQVNKLIAGSTRERISRSNLENIKLSIPSLEEQERIVKIIESKLTAVEKAKKASDEQIAIFRRLFISYIENIFKNGNWNKIKLKEICNFINGDAYKDIDWSNAGIPIVRIQNLNNINKPFNYWAGTTEDRITIDNNDLLLAWSGTPGTSFGAHIWNRGFALLNQHIFKVVYNEKSANPIWLKYAINQILSIMIEKSHGAVGLRHITKPEVENLEILLPPLDEQIKIVNYLETISNAVENVKKVIKEQSTYINALPSSILRKAFNGDY